MNKKKFSIVTLSGLLLCLLALMYYTHLRRHNFIQSQAAYLKSSKVSVNSPLSGKIDTIYVSSNQTLKKGQPIIDFDVYEYENKLKIEKLSLKEITSSINKLIKIKQYDKKQLSLGLEKKEIAKTIIKNREKLYQLILKNPSVNILSQVKKVDYLNSLRNMDIQKMDQESLIHTLNKNLIITEHEIKILQGREKNNK